MKPLNICSTVSAEASEPAPAGTRGAFGFWGKALPFSSQNNPNPASPPVRGALQRPEQLCCPLNLTAAAEQPGSCQLFPAPFLVPGTRPTPQRGVLGRQRASEGWQQLSNGFFFSPFVSLSLRVTHRKLIWPLLLSPSPTSGRKRSTSPSPS